MNISKLHLITQSEVKGCAHADLAEHACKAGADWIQLRVKGEERNNWISIASSVLEVCKLYKAKLIINDNVEVAQQVGADGVHLGKQDMPVAEARKILGKQFIIGGTANTFDDIKSLHEHVDYIGLGPFRFTKTKENLSPILGLEGYQNIIKQCRLANIFTPIIAIGGIKVEDIKALHAVGIHGVAVASAVNQAKDKSKAFEEFLTALQ